MKLIHNLHLSVHIDKYRKVCKIVSMSIFFVNLEIEGGGLLGNFNKFITVLNGSYRLKQKRQKIM